MNSTARGKPLFTLSLHNRRLELTREGGGFIFLIFGIGFGAINTGNNLLYLILAMCCSFIALSGILSELTLRQIAVEGEMPKTMFSGESYPVTLKLTNGKRRAPSYSLTLTLRHPFCATENPPYFLHLAAGETREKAIMLTPQRRGALQVTACHAATSFPFGFFIKSRTIPMRMESVVFPEIREVDLPEPEKHPAEGEKDPQLHGDEIFALREHFPGAPMSAVHWKATAKTGKMRLREFAGGAARSYTVRLDLPAPGRGSPAGLESRISAAASRIYHLIQRGENVRLHAPGYQSNYGKSTVHLETLLTYLAFAAPDDNPAAASHPPRSA